MKKITSIFIIFSIILGGLGATAFSSTEPESYELLEGSIRLQKSNIIIEEKGEEYLQVSLLDNEHYLLNPGKPVMPKLVQIFELPFGVTNINVIVSPSEIITQNILKQIQPSPAPLPLSPIEGYEIHIHLNSIDIMLVSVSMNILNTLHMLLYICIQFSIYQD